MVAAVGCPLQLFRACRIRVCDLHLTVLLGPARCYQAPVPTLCIHSLADDDRQRWNFCLPNTPSGVGWWK